MSDDIIPKRRKRTRSGSQKRQYNCRPSMVCNDEEYAFLEAAAEKAGMSLSAYLRHQCFGTPGPRAVRRPPIERTVLAQLLANIGKCGSNINQIARALNSGEAPPANLDEALAEVRAVAQDVIRALGRSPQ